jgi:hypothetical protein
MNSAFSDREKAFEDKWAHDEELRFKILARRNNLLGHWAAMVMGLKAAEADDYARAIIRAELTKEGDEAVFQKLKADFAAADIARTDHFIQRKMDELLQTAKNEVIHGG